MISSQDIKARRQLSRQLQETIQASDPDSVLNLFQAFDLTGFSYKGQLTSGYGERGTKVSFDVGFDFGALILPGLLTLEVEAGITGQKTRYTMTLVLRHPQALANPKWETVHPLCFAMLTGYAAEMSVHAGASASFGMTFEELSGVDELGFEVSAAAKGDVSGRILRLSDQQPRFYPPSSWDDSLSSDFIHEMDLMTRHQIKSLIEDWIKAQASDEEWGRVKKFVEEQTKEEREQVEERIEERKEAAEERISAIKDKLPLLDTLEEGLDAAGFTLEPQGFFKRIVRALRPPKTEDLLTALDKLDEDLPADEEEETEEIRRQIKVYQVQLKALQKKKKLDKTEKKKKRKTVVPASDLAHLCYLNLFTIDGGGSAEASAKANLKLTNPVKDSQTISAGAEAAASVAGRANMISFRLQTLASGSSPLVVTQDTVVNYREFDAAAAISANLDLDIPEEYKKEGEGEYEKGGSKSYQYRTMTYQSAVIYWLYPKKVGKSKLTVQPATGSGVSFGCGVQITRLIEAVKQLCRRDAGIADHIDEKPLRLVQRLAKQLHVPQQTLEQFLSHSGIEQDDPDQYKVEVVLLEAAFALPPAIGGSTLAIPLSVRNKKAELPDMLSYSPMHKLIKQQAASTKTASATADPHELALSCLRLRYRLSDGRDRSANMFKLGFSHVVSFDISVDKVKTSGHEGIIDLYTWFADEALNETPIAGQEVAVPPVALLHQ